MTIFLLVIQEGGQPGGLFGGMGLLIPMIAIFLIFYLFFIRPQKKRENERKAMIAAVAKDDRIITTGGIHGIVTKVDESSVLVDVSGGLKLRVERNSIGHVNSKNSS